MYLSDCWTDADKKQIDQNLSESLQQQSCARNEIDTIVTHITSKSHRSVKQQFVLLSTISNYHWMDVPTLNSDKLVDQSCSRYVSHVVFWQGDKKESRKYIPSSPRNRLIHLHLNHLTPSLYQLMKFLHEKDRNEPDAVEVQPATKKRRIVPRAVSITPRALCKSAGVDLDLLVNSAEPNRPLYIQFSEELISNGTIKWRSHDSHTDICLMTDINPSNGIIVPNSFVHVMYENNLYGQVLLKCTCQIYQMISRAARQEISFDPSSSDAVPDENFTCMHCRFYKQHLMNAYKEARGDYPHLTTPPIALEKVKTSLSDMDKPVFLIGDTFNNGTTKFSVRGESTHAIINLTFSRGRCNLRCSDGLCQVQMVSKKRIPKNPDMMKIDNLCNHLCVFKENIDYVKTLFPDYFSFEVNEEKNLDEVQLNTEDVGLKSDVANFDKENGLWDFKAVSKHIPKKMMDPHLVNYTMMRNQASIRPDGTVHLKPGKDRSCECGEGFSEECQYVLATTATLYTRIGAIPCHAYNLKCKSGKCQINFDETAAEQSIFFYSNLTCAGDEIGWDFVSLVEKTKTSFTAYCTEMTRRYQTNKVNAPKFMSGNTFVNWFFSWLSAMKIDFRKEIDPWCGHDPKVLACDGTHIGVNIKNMLLDKPVIMPDTKEVLNAKHRRKQRAIIEENESRIHLRYLSNKELNKLKQDEFLEQHQEQFRTLHLLQVLENMDEKKPGLYNFVRVFVDKTAPQDMLSWMAKILHMLSGDAAPSSVAPFRAHESILHVCSMHNIDHQLLTDLKQYSFEMAQLMILADRHNRRPLVEEFLLYIIDHIESVHNNNKDPPPAVPIQGSYNPPGGVAYYFSPTGEQLRKMPNYKIGDSSAKLNFDDLPVVHGACTKNYPGISYGGFGYMFIWFCPIHGHTYGFHLIAGGEGRRDPFCSLFKYKKTMPQDLFYDFACSLSEFALNREPNLFRNTRFWHDLFHALGHVCGQNFKSGRVVGLEGINTEICEQVNSYLQCIKYTASHLSQEHFMFFTQFFLYMLNCRKTEAFKQQITVAYQGQV